MNDSTQKDKKETYIKCVKCGDEIYYNTHKELVHCKCGAIWVDGCEDYVRMGGNREDFIQIQK